MNYAQNVANKRLRGVSMKEVQYNLDVMIPYLRLMMKLETNHRNLAVLFAGRWKRNKLTYEQKLGRLRMLLNEQ